MTTHHPEFRFIRPGALIAALPAVLGFVPEKSLVLVALEEGRHGRGDAGRSVRRSDRQPRPARRTAATSGADTRGGGDRRCRRCAVPDVQRRASPAVRRPDRGTGRPRCGPARGPCGRSGRGRRAAGTASTAAEPAGRWRTRRPRRWQPPRCSTAGVCTRRRADLHAVIAVADPDRSAGAGRGRSGRRRQRRGADWQADPDGRGRRDVETAMEVAARVADGRRASPTTSSPSWPCGLTDVAVRDTLYALAVGFGAAAAESLWATAGPDPAGSLASRSPCAAGIFGLRAR